MSWILASGRSPREGNGNPLQYSCLGNPVDRGAWWATVYGVAKNQDTTEHTQTHTQLSIHTHTHTHTGMSLASQHMLTQLHSSFQE